MNITNNCRLKRPAKFLLFCITFSVSISLFFVQPTTAYAAIDFKLTWDANTEGDLEGYEIYYRTSNSDYEFLGDVYLDELTDPDNPMVTITNLYNGVLPDSSIPVVNVSALAMVDGETYFFAVTAFDVQGDTSDFSEKLCLEVTGSSVAGCRSLNSSDDSGGGGGGGGCFIATTTYGFRKAEIFSALTLLLGFGIFYILSSRRKINK